MLLTHTHIYTYNVLSVRCAFAVRLCSVLSVLIHVALLCVASIRCVLVCVILQWSDLLCVACAGVLYWLPVLVFCGHVMCWLSVLVFCVGVP